MDVFDLAAKISLDTSPFEKGLDRAKGKMSAFGDVFKANIASDMVSKGFSAIVNGTKAAVGGLKTLVSESTNAFGEYEQMVGGVKKLYGNMGLELDDYAEAVGKKSSEVRKEWNRNKEAEQEVLNDAKNAYKEAGMSANQYMNIATQFSASLISSLGGNTKKAADQTKKAMVAISDNVNTFGSNMEDVTNAFKGFSKQNYTMLDNLKLGYGGTKTEMKRLVDDANEYAKSIGQAGNLSMDSFSDIVSAIELIQEKQHIAGTTAREASTTLQGSMQMVQSAWENLKTSIGSGDDLAQNVNNLVDSLVGHTATAADVAVGTADKVGDHVKGLLDNLLPTIETALKGIGNLIDKAAPLIAEKLPGIIEAIVPPVLSAIGTLASTVIKELPDIVSSIEEALQKSLGGAFDPSALASKVSELISGLADAVAKITPDIITLGANILTALIQGIADNADTLLNGAAEIVKAIGEGIIENLPQIVSAVVELLQSFTEYITDHKDEIQSGVQALVDALVQGIITLTPDLTEAALAIVTTLGGALIDAVPTILEQLPTFISELMGAITDAMSNASPEGKLAIAAVLAPIITGGISDAIGGIKDIKGGADAAKGIFGKIGDALGKVSGKGNAKALEDDLYGIFENDAPISNIDKLKTALTGLKDGLTGIGGKALDGLKGLGTTLANVGSTIGGGLLTGLKSLGGLLTGTVFPAIAGALPTILPIAGIIAGIALAIVGVIAVIKNWDKITETLKKGWDTLKGAAKKVFGPIANTISGAWDKAKKATSDKWKSIKGEVEKNGGGIKGVIKTAAKSWLSPWKDGFDALNKASGGKLGEAVEGVGKNLKNIQSKFKENNSKVKELAKGLVDKVKEGWSGITKAGGDFVRGIWEGINDKVGWVVEKVKGFGKKVLKGLKDFFKIKSPSRVMRDEVGVNIALGVAKGIEKGEKKAVSAATGLAKRVVASARDVALQSTKGTEAFAASIYNSIAKTTTTGTGKNKKTVALSQDVIDANYLKTAKSRIKELKDANKITEQQEASFWVAVAKRARKGSMLYSQAMAQANKILVQSRAERFEKAESTLSDYKNWHDVSAKYEATYWKKVMSTFARGTKERTKAEKNYNTALKSISAERLAQYQKEEQNYAALHNGREMNAASEVAYWKKAKQAFKKGTDEWITVQTNYLSKRKELQDSEKSANDSLKSSLTNAEETYQQAIQATIDKLSSRKEALLQSFGLFQQFEQDEAVSKDTLLSNIDSQVKGLKTWETQIAALKKRMGNTDLFKAIQEQGASGLNNVIALNTMTDEELRTYSEQYSKLDSLAENQAKKELGGTIKKDEEKALKSYMKSVSDAWESYKSTMSDLGVSVKKIPKSVKESLKKVGKDYSDVLDTMNYSTENKIKVVAGTLERGFKKISKGTKKYGADLMDNFIAGINSRSQELSKSVIKSIAKQVKKYIGFSEPEAGPLSNFHTFAPDMIDLFVKGINDNGAKVGQAFDDTLGIEDISDRISSAMTVPQRNTTTFAGIPNLTEIGSQPQQNGPTTLNITMQVDKTAFAKLVYQMNKAENQRVGVNLAAGVI